MVHKARHVLPSVAWVDGGNLQIPIRDLPQLSRIKAFVFRFEGVFTTGGAAAAVASTQLHRLIQMLDIGPQVRGSGQFFNVLRSLTRGAEVALPAGLPAANAETHRRTITWVVPFFDKRSWSPLDGCPIGADFNEKVISVDTAAFAGLDAATWGTLASIAGTLRVEAILAPPNRKPGSKVQFGFADLTGQAPTLAGTYLYEDLFLYRENAATISSAQVTTVAVTADGQSYYDQIRLGELTGRYNDLYATGSVFQTASATVPQGYELLPEAPAVTAGAAATVTTPVLPIIYPDPSAKKSQALAVESSLRVDFTGTDTSFRVGYRRVIPHTESDLVQSFAKLGEPVAGVSQIAAAPESGRALGQSKQGLARYIPVQRRK